MDQLLIGFVSAREQMEFQREMSNTAHTREVADLKAAGLNPVLSAHTSGASTPTGASDDMSTLLQTLQMSVANTAKSLSGSGGRGGSGINGVSEEDAVEFLGGKTNLDIYIDALRQNPKGSQKIFGVNVPNAFLVGIYDKYSNFFGENSPASSVPVNQPTSANPYNRQRHIDPNNPYGSVWSSQGKQHDQYIANLTQRYPGKSTSWYEAQWRAENRTNRPSSKY